MSGWGRDEGERMWPIPSGRMEPPSGLLTIPPSPTCLKHFWNPAIKSSPGRESVATIQIEQQVANFHSKKNYPYFVPNPKSKSKPQTMEETYNKIPMERLEPYQSLELTRIPHPPPIRPIYGSESQAVDDNRNKTGVPVETVPGFGTFVLTDHSWPIQFSRGKTNILFPFQCRPTAANTVKAWIEDVVREPINWWPLSPRRHPLPEGCVWVEWQCVRRSSSLRAVSDWMCIGLWQDSFDHHLHRTQDRIPPVYHRRRQLFAHTHPGNTDDDGGCRDCPKLKFP